MQAGRESSGGGRGLARNRNQLLFVLFDTAFVFFVVLPAILYLLVFDNGLSERQLVVYVIALVAMQALVTGLLLWKFRIVSAPPTEKRDAR